MMRASYRLLIFLVLSVVCLMDTSCSSSPPKIDTSELETAFQSAPPPIQETVRHASEMIKKGEYPAALSHLQPLRSQPLSKEQLAAIEAISAKVHQNMQKLE